MASFRFAVFCLLVMFSLVSFVACLPKKNSSANFKKRMDTEEIFQKYHIRSTEQNSNIIIRNRVLNSLESFFEQHINGNNNGNGGGIANGNLNGDTLNINLSLG